MTTTDTTAALDLDAIRAREQAATPGPWGWRGHISQSVELRALHSGGMRIISTTRPEPCIGYTADEELVLLDNACKACTAYLTGGGLGRGEDPKCEKPENLDTVWTWHPGGFIRPINDWAKAEVLQWSEHMYRDDVKDTTHPDAEFIAAARQDIPALLAEVDRHRARIDATHDALSRLDGVDEDSTATLESTVEYLASRWQAMCDAEAEAAAEVDRLRAQLDAETRAHGQTVDDRDRFEAMADRLAEAISLLTGADIGEHSSGNDPWMRALDAAEGAMPRPQLTTSAADCADHDPIECACELTDADRPTQAAPADAEEIFQ
ncbi:hypothetical protein [Micromonospora carbonacea]|uniref:Uncharacterized protein n=1 Tax=Micromonospora carbonacea TaxID=47853 RepID=A0A1C5AYZ3_9ACTN|nr:hypothetical protein [Micromonospora carbonacea]SCF50387.1 hypothetical protein GA0070563_13112 [Micromonospora carbonacea]